MSPAGSFNGLSSYLVFQKPQFTGGLKIWYLQVPGSYRPDGRPLKSKQTMVSWMSSLVYFLPHRAEVASAKWGLYGVCSLSNFWLLTFPSPSRLWALQGRTEFYLCISNTLELCLQQEPLSKHLLNKYWKIMNELSISLKTPKARGRYVLHFQNEP